MNFSGATLLDKFVGFLQQQPHVKVAVGVINHPIELPLVVTGVDLSQFNAMSGGFLYREGGPFQGPHDMIVDQYYASQRHAHAGDDITVMNRQWHVSGVIEGGKLSHIMVPLNTLQDLDSATGKLSQIYLKLDDPANTAAVIEDLKKKMPGYPIWSMEELTSMLSVNNFQGVKELMSVIMGIGVVIGFAVVC